MKKHEEKIKLIVPQFAGFSSYNTGIENEGLIVYKEISYTEKQMQKTIKQIEDKVLGLVNNNPGVSGNFVCLTSKNNIIMLKHYLSKHATQGFDVNTSANFTFYTPFGKVTFAVSESKGIHVGAMCE